MVFFAGVLQWSNMLSDAVVASEKLTRAHVQVTLSTNLSGREAVTQYVLDYARPSKARLEIIEPQQGSVAASDRIYAINVDQFLAYDRNTNEYLTRKAPSKGSLSEKLQSLIDIQDVAVQNLLDPHQLDIMFSGLRNPNAFTPSTSNGAVVFSRKAAARKGATRVVLRFNPKTHLLIRANFGSGPSHANWTYAYSPLGSATLAVPAGAKQVSAFYQRPIPPAYQSESARKVAQGAINTYRQLRSLSYVVAEKDGDQQTISWSGRKFRQESGGLAIYDGSVLLLKANGKIYRGPCSLARSRDYMAAVGLSIEPTLRLLLSGRNPIETLSRPRMPVRIAGHLQLGAGPETILELQGAGQRIELTLHDEDHLLAGSITELLGTGGKVMVRTEKTYRYLRATGPFDTSAKGAVLPLTTLSVRSPGP